MTRFREFQLGVLFSGVLFYFAYFSRSALTVLLLLIMVLLSLSFRSGNISISKLVMTPYMPFVVTLASIGAWQYFRGEPTGETLVYEFGSLLLLYFLARALRDFLPVFSIAVAVWISAVALGSLRLLGTSFVGESLPLVESFASLTDKNTTGWVLAFGLVSCLVLLISSWLNNRHLWLPSIAFALTLVMLVVVDSMTALIAGVLGTFAILLALVWWPGRDEALRARQRVLMWWGAGGMGAFLLALYFVQLLSLSFSSPDNPAGSRLLDRDFGTLTGRTRIWSCYFEVLSKGGSMDVWGDTQACSGFLPAHLHNIFLEAHLAGGIWLALLLVVGFVGSAALVSVRLKRTRYAGDLPDLLWSLGVTVAGLVIGLAESFLFYFLLFSPLVVFLAASGTPRRQVLPQMDNLRRLETD